jgi:hypothetical protein
VVLQEIFLPRKRRESLIGKAITLGLLATMSLAQALFMYLCDHVRFVPENQEQVLEEMEEFWKAGAASRHDPDRRTRTPWATSERL